MTFELFDPDLPVQINQGALPHWYQPGVTYFVTFRTADSVPASVAKSWRVRRFKWLEQFGIDDGNPDWKTRFQELSAEIQHEFHSIFSREFLEYLDRGYGECILKQRTPAKIVADSLLHFDGDRYHMGDFVIMPNHVHLLVCLIGDTDIEKQCYSWKKFTATQINKALGHQGEVWQYESFDHLIRNPDHYEQFRSYIAANPQKAGLREGEYLYRAHESSRVTP